METETLLRADYLDILFDQRNKNYGGYELRKHYNRRVAYAMTGLLALTLALSAYSFLVKNRLVQPLAVFNHPVQPTNGIVLPPPPPIHKTQPAEQPITHTDAAPPKIVTDVKVDMPIHETVPDVPASVPTGNESDGAAGTTGSGAIGVGNAPTAAPVSATPKVFKYASQMPAFNGNMDRFLHDHLQYPEAARQANIDGRVLVNFVVNEDGSITDVSLVRGIGGGCDEEAMCVIRQMPKWLPGKQNGVPVKVSFTVTINFVLQ